jgi:serpin B
LARFEELRSIKSSEGILQLPKFEIESDLMNLKDALRALGVNLFNESELPLDGLIEETSLFISAVIQKAFISVDEEGTTAAAVTVETGILAMSIMPAPSVPFEMIVNKPFVFLLCGRTVDGGMQILFTGVVNSPT